MGVTVIIIIIIIIIIKTALHCIDLLGTYLGSYKCYLMILKSPKGKSMFLEIGTIS